MFQRILQCFEHHRVHPSMIEIDGLSGTDSIMAAQVQRRIASRKCCPWRRGLPYSGALRKDVNSGDD